jgi:hypothetical protein
MQEEDEGGLCDICCDRASVGVCNNAACEWKMCAECQEEYNSALCPACRVEGGWSTTVQVEEENIKYNNTRTNYVMTVLLLLLSLVIYAMVGYAVSCGLFYFCGKTIVDKCIATIWGMAVTALFGCLLTMVSFCCNSGWV